MSSDIHYLGTRRAKHNLTLPMVSTSMAKNAVRSLPARNWSELPKDIKEAQSISTFSLKLKTYLSWGSGWGGGGGTNGKKHAEKKAPSVSCPSLRPRDPLG